MLFFGVCLLMKIDRKMYKEKKNVLANVFSPKVIHQKENNNGFPLVKFELWELFRTCNNDFATKKIRFKI